MKYCTHCGTELLDEAVVCTGCGCPVQSDEGINKNKESDEVVIQKRKKKTKRTIIIVSAVVCVAVALFFVSIPIVNSFKSNKIIKELSGETFECNEDTSYSISRERYTFDDEGNCEEYSYYYGLTMDDPMEFTFDWTYKIEFKKNSAYVVLSNDDELKIKYDEDGEIISLYDPESRTTYERE